MKVVIFRAALLGLLVFTQSSCSWWPHRGLSKKQQAQAALQAEEAQKRPHWVGKIILVNNDERFVLIDAEQWRAQGGVNLESSLRGTKTADLRTSDVQKRPFVIADIIHGDPSRDDEVWQPPSNTPAPTTAPKAPKSPSPAASSAAVSQEPPTPPTQPMPWWRRTLSRVGLLR